MPWYYFFLKRRNLVILHLFLFTLIILAFIKLGSNDAAKCPNGQFYDTGARGIKCKDCHPKCTGCIKNAYTCITCLNNTFLHEGKCISKCPSKMIENKNTLRCEVSVE